MRHHNGLTEAQQHQGTMEVSFHKQWMLDVMYVGLFDCQQQVGSCWTWWAVIEDELQHRHGEHHRDLKAQLLSALLGDEQGGHVQAHEEPDGQQEVDDV